MIDHLNHVISQTLCAVSSVLLLPTLLAVLALFLATLVLLGGFVREACGRRLTQTALKKAISLLDSTPSCPCAILTALRTAPSGLPPRFARIAARRPITPTALSKALADLEGDIAVSLGHLGFIGRVGPMLGLLGTLIPFGPALAGLASDEGRELSSHLATAFATAFAGLLSGALAFAIASVRRGWYRKDSDELDHLVYRLSADLMHETPENQKLGANGRRSDLRSN